MNLSARYIYDLRFRLAVVIRYVAERDGRTYRSVFRQAMRSFRRGELKPFPNVKTFEQFCDCNRGKINEAVKNHREREDGDIQRAERALLPSRDARREERATIKRETVEFVARAIRLYADRARHEPQEENRLAHQYARMIAKSVRTYSKTVEFYEV